MRLTFEYEREGIVEINFDAEGREALLELIGRIAPGSHDHLMTPSWGGSELTEAFPNPDLAPVHQVNLQFTDSEQPESV